MPAFRSTLPHGERPVPSSLAPASCGFDPRSRTGSDGRACGPHEGARVSIHAPARGATTSAAAQGSPVDRFRSTLPHGERRTISPTISIPIRFRSTLPHGERPPMAHALPFASRFRSTLPHGERPAARAESPIGYVFRSTLPHGERHRHPSPATCADPCFDPRSRTGSDLAYDAETGVLKWFRSTLPHGERRQTSATLSRGTMFRSTLPHGERRRLSGLRTVHCRFRSTLPHGERPLIREPEAATLIVSIHAPARGATTAIEVVEAAAMVSIHAPARGATGHEARGDLS